MDDGTPGAMSLPNITHRSLNGQGSASPEDGELLERFVAARDEAAFEDLLHRHGPMVLGVCRRALQNEADADDAFQATFLVLVRKAESIRPRSMVGNWLYGVAHNTALKARAMSTRRSSKEQAAARSRPQIDEPTWEHLQPLLDQELNALPDKYRSVIVLCDLEGKSLKQAARHLGCPLATIGTRVARGRQMLARRLARKCVVPSAGVLAFLMSQNGASASVPARLVEATAKAAAIEISGSASTGGTISASVATLTAAVVKALLLARLKIAMLVLLALSAITFAGGALAHQIQASLRMSACKMPRSDSDRLQDTWTLISVQQAGQEIAKAAFKDYEEWTFDGNKIIVAPNGEWSAAYAIDASKNQKEINLGPATAAVRTVLPVLEGAGIYKLEGHTLTICVTASPIVPVVRPTDFVSRGGEHSTNLFVLQRKSSDKGGGPCGTERRRTPAERIRREGR
jgi:RNA polymerase sigma factor (sigma-70 family)